MTRKATYYRNPDGKIVKSKQVNSIIEHDVLSETMSHVPADFEMEVTFKLGVIDTALAFRFFIVREIEHAGR